MTQKDASYTGLRLDQFTSLHPNQDFRIEVLDGDPQHLNADYNPDRINLTIENGVIVSVDWF